LTQTGNGYSCKSCFIKYGTHSSYNYLSDKCECDDDYTLKDGTCVEEQHNVYFRLKEVNTGDKLAIIQSEYTLQNYLIKYNWGCYSTTIKRYIGDKIVINLGTDYDLDVWDTMVLFDDNEVCDITSVKTVTNYYSLEEDEQEEPDSSSWIFTPPPTQKTQNEINFKKTPANTDETIQIKTKPQEQKQNQQLKCNTGSAPSLNKKYCVDIPQNSHAVESKTDVWLCDEGYKEAGNTCVKNKKESEDKEQDDNQKNILNEQTKEKLLQSQIETAQDFKANVGKFWKKYLIKYHFGAKNK